MPKRIIKKLVRLPRLPRLLQPSKRTIGAPPGHLRRIEGAPEPELTAIAYGPEGHTEVRLDSLDDVEPLRERYKVVWLDVDGTGHPELLEAFGHRFGIPALALEDIQNVPQRPKFDTVGDGALAIARMARRNDEGMLEVEQVSLYVSPGFVATFQERPGDVFEPLRERIRAGRARLINGGSDYLAYAILDSLFDHYFPLLEEMAERFDRLEEEIVSRPSPDVLGRIYAGKREVQALRRAAWPHRDMVQSLLHREHSVFAEETEPYLRDLYDHAIQIAELADVYRDFGQSLLDFYLSLASHRMNEVMKTLTIIATIFIPLTFVAGVYGMNFDPEASPWNMPELGWYWGYPAAWALMVLLAVGLSAYMWRRGWFRAG